MPEELKECRGCGEQIRPTRDGERNDGAAWIDEFGDVICVVPAHEPRGPANVWIVLVEDRHGDAEVFLFSSEERAVTYARAQAVVNAAHPERIREVPLTAAMREDGWVLAIDYSIESEYTGSDRVSVIRRAVDGAPE